jgi:hypothetical protein
LLAAFYQYYPKKQHKRKRRKTSWEKNFFWVFLSLSC